MPTDNTLTLDDLKQLIISSLDLEGLTLESIKDDQPLFGEGLGLDSIDALEIIIALEKRLGVKIHADQISTEDFSTVSKIHRFVEAHRAKATGSSE